MDNFVKEMNKELNPVLEIVQDKARNFPSFELRLCPNKYAMESQVVTEMDDSFEDLVAKISKKYFKTEPLYNNTGRCFWFI